MRSETREVYARAAAGDESAIAELIDEIEYRASELTRLRKEHDELRGKCERLETDLAISRRWVKMLANEVEALDSRLKAETQPLLARLGGSAHAAERPAPHV